MAAILTFLKNLFPPPLHNRIFLVGGTVRDLLLGTENHDIDLVAALSGGELVELGFRLVEATSGATIYFKHHHEFGKIEVTRIENRSGLEADLLRRDFTINAMAMALDGTHLDPLGGGKDLQAGLLRTCSGHSFRDDPLRIFRAYRFEADGWHLATEAAKQIRVGEWSDAFRAMPVERFSNEMLKAMVRRTPERFFLRMVEFNTGAELLPELFRMPLIPAGPLEHHPEGDLFTHSIQVLQRVAAMTGDPLPRFCALFHDLGKLATDPARYPSHHGHDDSGFAMAAEFCNRLCLPSMYRRALAWVSRLHGKANNWDELRDSSKIKLAEQALKAGIAGVLPLVSAADKAGAPPMAGWDAAVRIVGISAQALGIDREKLEAMPIGNRPTFILQKRTEALRESLGPIQRAG